MFLFFLDGVQELKASLTPERLDRLAKCEGIYCYTTCTYVRLAEVHITCGTLKIDLNLSEAV